MAGGLERNLIYLSSYLAELGNDVLIVTFDKQNTDCFFKMDRRVTWIALGLSKPHTKISSIEKIRLVCSLRATIKSYNVEKIICFTHGLLSRVFLSSLALNVKIICTERNALTMYDFLSQRKLSLNFILLNFVDIITVQFDAFKNDYPKWLHKKIKTVNNPVFQPSKKLKRFNPVLISVGRLCSQKQFDILISAFDSVRKVSPEWSLLIIGEGDKKVELETQIKSLGLGACVSIQPPKKNIFTLYQRATFFVSTSQWEGFPNAMAEAMAHGLIAVGFKQTAGVSKLILHETNGILIDGQPDAFRLAETLKREINNSQRWVKMSSEATSISKIYSVENWKRQWKETLLTI